MEIGFTVVSALEDVTVKVNASSDMAAELVQYEGLAGKVRVDAGNIIEESSKVTFTLSDGRNTVSHYLTFVPVEGEVFEFPTAEVTLFDTESDFNVTLMANLEYEVAEIPSWLELVKSEAGDAKRTVILSFRAQENTAAENRTGEVVLVSENKTRISLTINQMGKNDAARPFFHRSVAVRYTADWCGYCPQMASGFEEAEKLMPGRLEVISMHCDGALVFSQSSQLMSQFNITGFPMGIIDGRMLMQNYDVATIAEYTKRFAEETAELYSTVSGIVLDTEVRGRDVEVNVKAFIKNADSYKITVMLVEDGIVGYQANYFTGSTNNYVHNGVPRKALTNVRGADFSTSSDNTVKEFSYSAPVEEKYDLNNMKAVVYIQRSFGSRDKVQSADYGDFYIDNCAACKVGESVELRFQED